MNHVKLRYWPSYPSRLSHRHQYRERVCLDRYVSPLINGRVIESPNGYLLRCRKGTNDSILQRGSRHRIGLVAAGCWDQPAAWAAGPGAALAAVFAYPWAARAAGRVAASAAVTKRSNHDLCMRLQGFVMSVVAPSLPPGVVTRQRGEVSSFDSSPSFRKTKPSQKNLAQFTCPS